jgi:hypothetical protein
VTSPRRLSNRIGGLTYHAKHGSTDLSRLGVQGNLARFEREVDPGNLLPAEERRSRALALRRAHMARLALASAKARTKKSGATK